MMDALKVLLVIGVIAACLVAVWFVTRRVKANADAQREVLDRVESLFKSGKEEKS